MYRNASLEALDVQQFYQTLKLSFQSLILCIQGLVYWKLFQLASPEWKPETFFKDCADIRDLYKVGGNGF